MDIILADTLEKSITDTICDGYGYRLCIFTNGCPHHCKGCHNPSTWNIEKGVSVKIDTLVDYIAKKIKKGYYDGITLSGGDPLFQEDALLETLTKLKALFPNLNIWCYTGYLYEEVKEKPVIKLINTLVDGRFEEDKKKHTKPFRGSWNQRILYLDEGAVTKEE